jgi:hypothetical protein
MRSRSCENEAVGRRMVTVVRAELARLDAAGTPLGVLALLLAEDLDAGVRSAGLVREFRLVLRELAGKRGVDDELADLLAGATLGD